MCQLIDQPELRGRLHPRAYQRNKLSHEEQLKIAVLQSAKAREHEREFPPSIGRRAPPSRRKQSFTMKPTPNHCQSHATMHPSQFAPQLHARSKYLTLSTQRKSTELTEKNFPLCELCAPSSVHSVLKNPGFVTFGGYYSGGRSGEPTCSWLKS